jgi:hypothetical protein
MNCRRQEYSKAGINRRIGCSEQKPDSTVNLDYVAATGEQGSELALILQKFLVPGNLDRFQLPFI